ncbi:MAG: hypothetical protein ACKVOH_01735 [Chlamydiales bacterium]
MNSVSTRSRCYEVAKEVAIASLVTLAIAAAAAAMIALNGELAQSVPYVATCGSVGGIALSMFATATVVAYRNRHKVVNPVAPAAHAYPVISLVVVAHRGAVRVDGEQPPPVEQVDEPVDEQVDEQEDPVVRRPDPLIRVRANPGVAGVGAMAPVIVGAPQSDLVEALSLDLPRGREPGHIGAIPREGARSAPLYQPDVEVAEDVLPPDAALPRRREGTDAVLRFADRPPIGARAVTALHTVHTVPMGAAVSAPSIAPSPVEGESAVGTPRSVTPSSEGEAEEEAVAVLVQGAAAAEPAARGAPPPLPQPVADGSAPPALRPEVRIGGKQPRECTIDEILAHWGPLYHEKIQEVINFVDAITGAYYQIYGLDNESHAGVVRFAEELEAALFATLRNPQEYLPTAVANFTEWLKSKGPHCKPSDLPALLDQYMGPRGIRSFFGPVIQQAIANTRVENADEEQPFTRWRTVLGAELEAAWGGLQGQMSAEKMPGQLLANPTSYLPRALDNFLAWAERSERIHEKSVCSLTRLQRLAQKYLQQTEPEDIAEGEQDEFTRLFGIVLWNGCSRCTEQTEVAIGKLPLEKLTRTAWDEVHQVGDLQQMYATVLSSALESVEQLLRNGVVDMIHKQLDFQWIDTMLGSTHRLASTVRDLVEMDLKYNGWGIKKGGAKTGVAFIFTREVVSPATDTEEETKRLKLALEALRQNPTNLPCQAEVRRCRQPIVKKANCKVLLTRTKLPDIADRLVEALAIPAINLIRSDNQPYRLVFRFLMAEGGTLPELTRKFRAEALPLARVCFFVDQIAVVLEEVNAIMAKREKAKNAKVKEAIKLLPQAEKAAAQATIENGLCPTGQERNAKLRPLIAEIAAFNAEGADLVRLQCTMGMIAELKENIWQPTSDINLRNTALLRAAIEGVDETGEGGARKLLQELPASCKPANFVTATQEWQRLWAATQTR